METDTISNTQRLKSYTDLAQGDYVVHANHGIGKYLGLKTIKSENRHHVYLVILYRHHSKIYVPIQQINLIQKYISAGERHPTLSSLDTNAWSHTKKRVYHKTQHIADRLISIYARRNSETGIAYPSDDRQQRVFDRQFKYTPTPDQIRSVKEIKLDMERPHPMDRLLVGDVGYGKTEVALRAAFKAIEAGYQVAILVPTTILAIQHCETILKRFGKFPVRIGLLSSFSTSDQIKMTIASLKKGKIDIVIGTHRMLSKDVGFSQLGLLVIDEEQRFGVVAKNRIKARYPNIDVLTLTATPIPRTLNMAMMGVRDLSIIETPPTDRKPIKTYVTPEHKSTIRNAILRELKRHGQVFFLHNRVADIDNVTIRLHQIVPHARIAYIDGRMDDHDIEHTLMAFVNHKYDILVTTTIIETGIDIPNVNTLFVENADHMGLSQLYQLRGRVGRSGRQAYAYLMYQPHRTLTENGQRRLDTMRKYNSLGSGFHIAMRDLTIRGGGTLLGASQHGFINSIGYNMYTKLLSTAVSHRRGIPSYRYRPAKINLDADMYLPIAYLGSDRRLEIYHQLNTVNSVYQLSRIKKHLINTYGALPNVVNNLFIANLLRIVIQPTPITQIDQMPSRITLTISKSKITKQQLKSFLPNTIGIVFKPIGSQIGMDLNFKRSTVKDRSWIKIILNLAQHLTKK